MSDISKYIKSPVRGDFKGNPMLYLPTGKNGYRWGFGLTKADLILQNQNLLEERADVSEGCTLHGEGKYNQVWELTPDQVKAVILYREDIYRFVDDTLKDRQFRKGDFKTIPSSFGRDFN